MKNIVVSLIISASIIYLNGCGSDSPTSNGTPTNTGFFTSYFNPVAGDQFTFYNVDTFFTYNGGAVGDTVYDFTSITILHNDSSGMVYVAPSSTPYSSTFPSATVASYTLRNNTFFAYYNCSSSVNQNLGYGSPGTNLVYTDPQTILAYPLNQGTPQTDHYSGQQTIAGIVHYISGDYTINFNSEGMLMLPPMNGFINYIHAARVYHYATITDSSQFGVNTSINEGYQWWSQYHKFPLFNYEVLTTAVSQRKTVWINKQVSP